MIKEREKARIKQSVEQGFQRYLIEVGIDSTAVPATIALMRQSYAAGVRATYRAINK